MERATDRDQEEMWCIEEQNRFIRANFKLLPALLYHCKDQVGDEINTRCVRSIVIATTV